MTDQTTQLSGPDFVAGVALSTVADGVPLLGHAHGEPVILVRRGDDLFAVGAFCTHYGGPLAEGLLVDETIRCPWHHACFSLRTGEALRAPALNPIACRRVEQRDGTVHVGDVIPPEPAPSVRPAGNGALSASIVIVGGGAAGHAAAEMLRHEGHAGTITMLSADDSLPCDRPNLSKNYLAGSAPEDWIPLRSAEFYREQRIDVKLNALVVDIDTVARQVQLEGGRRLDYGALLLATGAEPVRLAIPGADLPHVHYLRTWSDSRALVGAAKTARRAVVIGASFIGLEVAASLRARHVDVQVVGRESVPMEPVLGSAVGAFIRQLHETHGVTFHLGTTPMSIDEHAVTLANGQRIDADLVVIGIGVRPVLRLAEQAGLAVDRGVTVDAYLATNVAGIYAAGDIARWPDRLSGDRIRVEHWVVAQRQGQVAARNMLGAREPFDGVPFFWTEQYDFGLAYVGHAERFERAEIDGSLEARDCKVTYWRGAAKLAVAVVRRDLEGLREEVEFERTLAGRLIPPKAH
jgi:NADPH-dependent 2,4-dienoyl-CoA reductase/sulfur reductase-like enzyme/nitrite reductase/ring-hydroxylating ferredoxin subunit